MNSVVFQLMKGTLQLDANVSFFIMPRVQAENRAEEGRKTQEMMFLFSMLYSNKKSFKNHLPQAQEFVFQIILENGDSLAGCVLGPPHLMKKKKKKAQ